MKYAVLHEHCYGNSLYFIRCNHLPSEEEVVKALKLDFEPDKEEFITIFSSDEIETRDIPDA